MSDEYFEMSRKDKIALTNAVKLLNQPMYLSKDSEHYKHRLFGKGKVTGVYVTTKKVPNEDETALIDVPVIKLQFVILRKGGVQSTVYVEKEFLSKIESNSSSSESTAVTGFLK